jgi:hypothetical protein
MAVNEYDDTRPKPKTQREEGKQADEEDRLKKDYGQSDIYGQIHALSKYSRWKGLAS